MTKYKRILLKLSGEALMGNKSYGIDPNRLNEYAKQIKTIIDKGVQVGVVIGGGNIFRGLSGATEGFDRINGDYMGMMATVINCLALQSSLENVGCESTVLTAIRMEPIAEFYSKQKTQDLLKKGNVVIFSAGTGNPYFTTDTASALRAIEMKADIMLKGTRVDGIYTADPEKDKNATKYKTLTFKDAYNKNLKIMDLTSFTMCKENNMPILVFDMNTYGNLEKVILGEDIGTIVSN
jgi:uridylate kinase